MRLQQLKEDDDIFIEEPHSAGWYRKTSQAFAYFSPVKFVEVVGRCRYEGGSALRAVETIDFMTVCWTSCWRSSPTASSVRLAGFTG